MIFFTLFIWTITISLFLTTKYIYGLIFLILGLLFLKKQKFDIKIIKFIVIILFILLAFFFIKKILINKLNLFIVLEKKENYSIIFDGINKYYFKTSNINNIYFDEFDIIKLTQTSLKNLDFTVLESGFDFNEYLFKKGIEYELNFENVQIIFNNPIDNFKIKTNILNSIKDTKVREYLEVILFNKSSFNNENFDRYRDLNIISIFSLSGIFINFIYYKLLSLFEYGFNKRKSSLLALIILLPFLLINISKFIVLKTILMMIFSLINDTYLENKLNSLERSSIIGTIILLFEYHFVNYESFIISFGINFLNSLIYRTIKEKNIFIKKLKINLAIMLFLFPFTLKFNNSYNFLSFVLIFIFLPINKIIFVFGLVIFVFKSNLVFEKIIAFLINIMKIVPDNFMTINVPPFNDLLVIGYYLIFFLILYLFEIRIRKSCQILSFISAIFIIFYSLPISNYSYFKINFINVGQGDSTLITYKNKNILIDTGGNIYSDLARNNLIPFFKKNRIYKIDYVLITHYDFDHYGALESLINNYRVDNIYDYNNFSTIEFYDLKITNLNYDIHLANEENDKSLVLNVLFKDKNFLLMGDASKEIEEKIIKRFPNLKADYLKIGHHGSKTSTSEYFLKQVQPKETIISAGKNNLYKHPNKEVIDLLMKEEIKIRRTDQEGTIEYKILSF